MIETELATTLSTHPSSAKSYSLIAKTMGGPLVFEGIVAECASPTLTENIDDLSCWAFVLILRPISHK